MILILEVFYQTKNYVKKKSKNILIYDISYKTSTGAKPLRIRYNEIYGFIKIHNKIRYLVLFDKQCDKICSRIKDWQNTELNASPIYNDDNNMTYDMMYGDNFHSINPLEDGVE